MPTRPVKRRKEGELPGNLESAKSARELAEPYRVCTTRFPIDALTPHWSIGRNRPVNQEHVLSLCKTFEGEDGLQRETARNYLMIGCTEAQLEKMRFYYALTNSPSSWADPVVGGDWHSAHEWMAANEQKAEIISGQHRVEALKMFLVRGKKGLHSSEPTERWWTCDIYNLGKPPYESRNSYLIFFR